MQYPKLLIINNYSFNEYKGGGITLKNLFEGWPKDKLAIAHLSESKPMPTVCEKYYKIGYNESHYIFPINKISTEPRGKINGPYSRYDFINTHFNNEIDSMSKITVSKNSIIKKMMLHLIGVTGMYEYVHPLRMSKSLINWILDFNPEIIYCQPENISFINIVWEVYRLTNAKLVVHVMDDWPYLIYKDKIFGFLLRKIINRKFQKLLDHSTLRLGISQAMAEEFHVRYNLLFKYFHNPIDVTKVNELMRTKKDGSKPFLVVYSGRIGWTACHDSIIEFCKCIEELRNDGLNIFFNIYTDLNDKENDFSQFEIDGTNLLPALKDDDFITKLQEADLLLYPVDFDQKSIEFIRLSFPTKLPSYLISGTPIYCYGPPNVYSIRFMKENRLGFICNDQLPDILKQSIIEAINNTELRIEYSKRAIEYAKNNFEASKVRTSFHKEIVNCLI